MEQALMQMVSIYPSKNQVDWQALGFTAFLHYGINTFTNREWGDGKEDPAIYNPSNLDTDQWCKALKAAGVTACIITAKHHDGFCLFDTAHTKHSVMYSPKPVDVVAALGASCTMYGLKMGVYLSPWDRNAPTYGSGKAYDDYFCAQLEELTTKYGPLYSLWFDGACGEGPNGKKQIYDWARYYALIRKNQPQAVIAVCGPDVRWIGNEAGYTRPSEWSVVPARMRNTEATAALSQQQDDSAFRERPISSQDEDLGSRGFLQNEMALGGELCWYPAEVDVSIRPGWFYHKEEDGAVRSLENLLDIYEKSVGGNAVLLLNIPPDTTGQLNKADADRLKELGNKIAAIYTNNLLEDATTNVGQNILQDNQDYWLGNNESEEITIQLPAAKALTHIVLCEQVLQSQRVEAFTILAEADGNWQNIYSGTTIGFKKICRFPPVSTKSIRIVINQSRIAPTIRYIAGHYDAPGI
ncbi:MAG: alpha-L-fucosidase [Defluviitaleaceae bacterium]|nr:alpha-L-fucosidase [Defluviitaleaceae bacterium]